MERLGAEEIGRSASIRQVAFASFIGTAMSLWTFAAGALYSITGVFIAELFEARVRYSSISFGYQMAGMLGGALAPIIATALIQWAGGASWPVATYLAANSLVSLVAVYLATERYRVEIHDARGLAGERG